MGAVWCGVVWCGVVWCGVVWCGAGWGGVRWGGVGWGSVWGGVGWRGVGGGAHASVRLLLSHKLTTAIYQHSVVTTSGSNNSGVDQKTENTGKNKKITCKQTLYRPGPIKNSEVEAHTKSKSGMKTNNQVLI